MADVLDVITAALVEIGALSAGETASGDDATLGLDALNRWIDQKAAESLTIYTITRTTWNIASGNPNYLVGLGQAVNVARPVFVDNIQFQDTSLNPVVELPLARLTDAAYQGLVQKAQTSLYPQAAYYSADFPSGLIFFWPTPTSATLQGVLYAGTPIQEFIGLNQTIALPPGYRRWIVKNLALELLPSYSRPADPVLIQQAANAEGTIKRANKILRDLTFDPGALIGQYGVFNIYTGQ